MSNIQDKLNSTLSAVAYSHIGEKIVKQGKEAQESAAKFHKENLASLEKISQGKAQAAFQQETFEKQSTENEQAQSEGYADAGKKQMWEDFGDQMRREAEMRGDKAMESLKANPNYFSDSTEAIKQRLQILTERENKPKKVGEYNI